MTESTSSSRVALGAIGAVVVLGGVWSMATLRAENAILRERVARYEGEAQADQARAVLAGEPGSPESGLGALDGSQRILRDEQRTTMRDVLSAERGRKVWFEMQPHDPEAAAFQREIEAVFRESGWTVAGTSEASYRIRPGIYIFMADDSPAAHVKTALRGLEAADLRVFAGTGYRAFYEERQGDPSFRGHWLAPGQEFVIVVGPKNRDSDT